MQPSHANAIHRLPRQLPAGQPLVGPNGRFRAPTHGSERAPQDLAGRRQRAASNGPDGPPAGTRVTGRDGGGSGRHSDDTSLVDHFLIAMPALDDPNFSRAVIYVCQHDDHGAMGLTINRRGDFDLSHVLEQVGQASASAQINNQPVLLGGPVMPERGFVLHQTDERRWDSSLQVTAQLAVTTSRDILHAFSDGQPPRRQLFALGYAGWGAGQLERELLDNAWLTVPADHAILFDTPIEQRWQAAAGLIGIDPLQLSGYSGHA